MLMLEQRLTAWEHLINLLFREEFLAAERAALLPHENPAPLWGVIL
jgi:hypothetical protein